MVPSVLFQSRIIAPCFIRGRDYTELHCKLAEIPVSTATDNLAILVHLGCRATRDGGFSGGRGAEEIRIMRGLPYPLHIAPLVIVELCAQKDVVGQAVVIGFQFPLPPGEIGREAGREGGCKSV